MIRIICKNQFNEVEWEDKTRSWKKAWQIVRGCGANPEEVTRFGDILIIQPNRKGTSSKNDNPLHLLSRRNVLPQRIPGTTWKRKSKETLSKEERAERYRHLRSIGYTANDASRIRDFYPWNYRRWATPEADAEIASLRAAYPNSWLVPNPWFIPAIRAGVKYGPAAYRFGKGAYGLGRGAYKFSKGTYGTIRGKRE